MNPSRKKFVLIIRGYSSLMYSWQTEEKYHLHALCVAKQMGYETFVLIKSCAEILKNDPDFDPKTKVIEYKNTWRFLMEIIKFSLAKSTIYANSNEIESLIAPLVSRRVIFMAHEQPKRNTFLKQKIQNVIYRMFKRIRLNNITEKAFLEHEGINDKKLYIVPLVVAIGTFKKRPPETASQDIVYFGNVATKKDLPTILRALKIVLDRGYQTRLHIIGNISDQNFWQTAEAVGVKKNIVDHGYKTQAEAAVLLNQIPICVNSSLQEGQCLSVYQAALAGCALCLPSIMSFVDVFKDKALFHQTGDSETLALNIIHYLKQPDDRLKNVMSCQKMISQNFSKEKIEPLMIKFFAL